jgi:ubiquinone/menaquinone biosynthesis C-methylase UbiE
MSQGAAEPSHSYVMTHTSAERRRLALQASILEPYTDRFLRDAGIAGGMHVLDFGCGVGDVSLKVGHLVGRDGSVLGIDVDPEAVAIATARASEEGIQHVRFLQADIASFRAEKQYDAVTGRHILVHTPDPIALIRRAASFVHPGGIVAFQEFDLSFVGPAFDDLPLWNACGTAIASLFTRAGLPVRAGCLLYTWFLQAGLPAPQSRLEYIVESGERSLYYEWLAETMRSLLPKMKALGCLPLEVAGIDQLQDKLRHEAVASKRPLLVGPMGAAFVRTSN